jgi:hypothetical protein
MSQLLDEIALESRNNPSDNIKSQVGFAVPEQRDPGSAFRSLRISDDAVSLSPTNTTPTYYDEEMDWSPTQSKHRAFSSYRTGQQASQGFGQAPTEASRGHFWYRVPPAPTTPAQRIFNPPNQPRLRKNPVNRETEDISFRGSQATLHDRGGDFDPSNQSRPVTFAETSFFPPTTPNDPRNSLSELFEAGFTLTPEQDEDRVQERRSWMGNLVDYLYPSRGNRQQI